MSESTERKTSARRRPPAMSLEDREDQLIAMAEDLAEKKLRDGTASNQLILHYLGLGSTKGRLEKENLGKKNELLTAQTESVRADRRNDELYRDAIEAMRSYRYEASGDEY